MKKLRQSKTFWVNLLVVVAGAIGGVMGTDVIASNPEIVGYFTMAVGVINMVLRVLTNRRIEGV